MSKHALSLVASLVVSLVAGCSSERDDASPDTSTAAVQESSGGAPGTTSVADDGVAESSDTGSDAATTSDATTTDATTLDATTLDAATTDDVSSSESSGESTSSGEESSTGEDQAGVDCGPDFPCNPGSVCVFPMGDCGEQDGLGDCVPNIAPCPLIYLPVCGCNGVTYDNECMALSSGVDVAADGPC